MFLASYWIVLLAARVLLILADIINKQLSIYHPVIPAHQNTFLFLFITTFTIFLSNVWNDSYYSSPMSSYTFAFFLAGAGISMLGGRIRNIAQYWIVGSRSWRTKPKVY